MNRLFLYGILFFISSVLIMGCGSAVKQQSVMDTPENQHAEGMRALKEGNLDAAEMAFNRAKGLNGKFAPAYEGLALVALEKKLFDAAVDNIEQAKFLDDKIPSYFVTSGKINAVQGKFKKAVSEYEQALSLDKNFVPAYLGRGRALVQLNKLEDAKSDFTKCLEIDKNCQEAVTEIEQLSKMEIAVAGEEDDYIKIAKKAAINKADLAALFMKELDLDKLMKPRTPEKKFDTTFQTPENRNELKEAEAAPAEVKVADDIEGNWAKGFIERVVALGIPGLEVYSNHTFLPDQPITKAELSMIIQSVLVALFNDTNLETKFIGNESPFPDVRSDNPSFNSIMVTTTRGLLKANADGSFGLMDNVSGVDALYIMKTLRSEINK